MKKITCTMLMAVALVSAPAARADDGDVLRGALIGSAVGAIVGHNSSDLDTSVAVPAFAALGGLIGYAHDRSWYRDDDPYDVYHHGSYGHWPWWGRSAWADDPWVYPRWGHPRRAWAAPRTPKPPDPQVAATRAATAPDTAEANRHPGVELLTVRVSLPAGHATEVRILKIGDQFVGPRGQTYAEMPTPEQLAADLKKAAAEAEAGTAGTDD
jgi:hypothetical protein